MEGLAGFPHLTMRLVLLWVLAVLLILLTLCSIFTCCCLTYEWIFDDDLYSSSLIRNGASVSQCQYGSLPCDVLEVRRDVNYPTEDTCQIELPPHYEDLYGSESTPLPNDEE